MEKLRLDAFLVAEDLEDEVYIGGTDPWNNPEHVTLTIAQVYLLAAWLDGWIAERGVRAPKKEK